MKKVKLKVNKAVIYWKHPEQKEDEFWIGNYTFDLYKKLGWKSKRKGEIPYNIITEQPIKGTNMFPVFIAKEDWINYNNERFIIKDADIRRTIKRRK